MSLCKGCNNTIFSLSILNSCINCKHNYALCNSCSNILIETTIDLFIEHCDECPYCTNNFDEFCGSCRYEILDDIGRDKNPKEYAIDCQKICQNKNGNCETSQSNCHILMADKAKEIMKIKDYTLYKSGKSCSYLCKDCYFSKYGKYPTDKNRGLYH